MTHSDSPDFEFDPANLEVEGEGAPASEAGSSASSSEGEKPSKRPEDRSEEEESFEGFSIDEMPDVYAESKADAVEAPETEPVTRIEKEKPSSRPLGEDDVGANVFEEIDSDSGLVSFDQVIDDLMEEVETYEAGGVVNLDAEGSENDGKGGADGLFNLNDPDDSLSQFIDELTEEEIPAPKPIGGKTNSSPASPTQAAPKAEPSKLDDAPVPSPPVSGSASRTPSAKPPVAGGQGKPVDISNFEIPSDEMVREANSEREKLADSEEPPSVSNEPVALQEEVPGESLEDFGELSEMDEDRGETVNARENVFYSSEESEELLGTEDEAAEGSEEESEAPTQEVEAVEEAEAEAEEADDLEPLDGLEESGSVAPVDAQENLEELAAEADSSESVDEIPETVREEELPSETTQPEAATQDVESATVEPEAPNVASEELEEIEEIEEEVLGDEVSPPEVEDELESIAMDEESQEDEAIEAVKEEELEEIGGEAVATPEADEVATPETRVDEEEAAVEGAEPSESVETDLGEVEAIDPSLSSEEKEIKDESRSKPSGSTEDLLRFAGSVLNGGDDGPAFEASGLLEDSEEEVVAMPSPESLMSELASDDEEEDVISLPDPESLMSEGGDGLAVIDDDDELPATDDSASSGNVADRAGDLPPPPPAPIEIIDEEPPEEDQQVEEPEESSQDEPAAEKEPSEAEPESDGLQDPFDSDISLADFDEGFGDLEDFVGSQEEQSGEDEAAESKEAAAQDSAERGGKLVEMPKPGLLWRITHSLSIAAGFVLLGAASVLAIWKQQILEYIDGRDLDGSSLVQQVREIGLHVLGDFGEDGLYRMQWVDSEVKRVSENEIRLHAVIGAQLREDLYKPVLESELGDRFDFSEDELMSALAFAHENYPEEIGRFPEKPWNRLYETSASKGEIVPLKVTYGLVRSSEEEEWTLSRVKVSGYKEELKWPEGKPAYVFGEDAYDVESESFKDLLGNYRAKARSYVARIEELKSGSEEAKLALKRENEQQRERVRMALSEGAFFDGVAIIGEDAVASQKMQLVITEVRQEGGFIKGVVRMSSEGKERRKHFVGSLDFEENYSGKEQGILNLRTVAMDSADPASDDVAFFDPNSVSRMRLKADGFRLEGDLRDLSFRLTRNL